MPKHLANSLLTLAQCNKREKEKSMQFHNSSSDSQPFKSIIKNTLNNSKNEKIELNLLIVELKWHEKMQH